MLLQLGPPGKICFRCSPTRIKHMNKQDNRKPQWPSPTYEYLSKHERASGIVVQSRTCVFRACRSSVSGSYALRCGSCQQDDRLRGRAKAQQQQHTTVLRTNKNIASCHYSLCVVAAAVTDGRVEDIPHSTPTRILLYLCLLYTSPSPRD